MSGEEKVSASDKVTIYLNRPALERLLGGDTELEVKLRHQVVEEFANKHIRAIAERETFKAACEVAKQYVNLAAKETFDIENIATGHLWPTVGYRLKSVIETEVNKLAQSAIDQALRKIIQYQQSYWNKEIERAVNKGLEKEVEKQIQEGIRKRLEAVAPQTGAVNEPNPDVGSLVRMKSTHRKGRTLARPFQHHGLWFVPVYFEGDNAPKLELLVNLEPAK